MIVGTLKKQRGIQISSTQNCKIFPISIYANTLNWKEQNKKNQWIFRNFCVILLTPEDNNHSMAFSKRLACFMHAGFFENFSKQDINLKFITY